MPVETYDPNIDVIGQQPIDPLEAKNPDNSVEDAPNREAIRTREFRQELADIGFISLMEEADKLSSDKPLTEDEKKWEAQFEADPFEDPNATKAERMKHAAAFGMLLRALYVLQQAGDKQRQAESGSFSGNGSSPAAETEHQQGADTEGQDETAQTGHTHKRRRSHYQYRGDSASDASKKHDYRKAAYERFMHGKPSDTTPRPDFMPAPSMGNKQEGPSLPYNGMANERVSAYDTQGESPRRATEQELQSARLANKMYERALYDVGWRGGDITDEQKHSAYREMGKRYREQGAPEEKAAYQAFLVTQDKPEHVADRKAGHEAKKAADRAADRAAEQQTATPQPKPAAPEAPAQTSQPAPANEAPKAPLAIESAPADTSSSTPAAPSTPSNPSTPAAPSAN